MRVKRGGRRIYSGSGLLATVCGVMDKLADPLARNGEGWLEEPSPGTWDGAGQDRP